MLRSSKEGRKQAARYHAFPSAKYFPPFSSSSRYDAPKSAPGTFAYQQQYTRPTQQPTAIDLNSTLQHLPNEERLDAEQAEKDLQGLNRQPDRSPISSRSINFDEDSSAQSASDEQEQHEQHRKMRLDTISPQSEIKSQRNLAEPSSDLMQRKDSEASNDRPLTYHDIEADKEKTPSRGTTEDNSRSSALSSPPTSQHDDASVEDDNDSSLLEVQKLLSQRGNDYGFTSTDSIFGSDGHDSTYNDGAPASQGTDLESNSRCNRPKHNRLKPRDVQGVSLLASRSPRSKIKTLKKVEAEESLSPVSSGSGRGRKKKTKELIIDFEGSDNDSESASPKRVVGKGKEKEKEVTIVEANTIIKRKRGRPLGSTKQKRLQRLQREAKEDSEISEISLIESVEESPAAIEEEDKNDGVARRSRRLTEPNGKMNEALVNRRGRVSLPNLSSSSRIKSDAGKIEPVNKASEETEVVAKSTKQGTSSKPLWKRKMFLNAGLYSDDFKHEESVKSDSKRLSREATAQGTSKVKKGKSTALPLPADYGYWMLVEKKDFRLPYPIAQKVSELREKMEAKKKPPPYKHISQNRYFSRSKLPGEILICQCPPSGNCGDSCVNRQTEYLCHPKHCPCGDRCTNIYFGKRKAAKTEVQWYGARGFGLKTLEAIPKGGFIDEYRGEVIEFNEAVRRVRDHYKETGNYYFLMYDAPAGEMLDGGLKGNVTRFANHSCDPNCKVQKWLICGTDEARSGEFQVALFAERDIEIGEELTYDYGWSAFAAKAVSGESSAATPEECHCGATNCSGFLGVKKATVSAGTAMAKTLLKRAKKKRRAKPMTADKTEMDTIDVDDQIQSKGGKIRKESSSLSLQQRPQADAMASISRSPMLLKEHFANAVAAATTKALQSPIKKRLDLQSFGPRQGLMDRMLGGGSMSNLIDSPSSLTSLSDADRFDREASFDESVDDLANKIMQSTPTLSRAGSSSTSLDGLGKRKRVSSISTKETIDEAHRLESLTPTTLTMNFHFDKAQEVIIPSRNQMESTRTILDQVPKKKKKLKVKDRVIKILVPRDELLKEKSLIVEGKRDRKLTEKAFEQENLSRQISSNKRVKKEQESQR